MKQLKEEFGSYGITIEKRIGGKKHPSMSYKKHVCKM